MKTYSEPPEYWVDWGCQHCRKPGQQHVWSLGKCESSVVLFKSETTAPFSVSLEPKVIMRWWPCKPQQAPLQSTQKDCFNLTLVFTWQNHQQTWCEQLQFGAVQVLCLPLKSPSPCPTPYISRNHFHSSPNHCIAWSISQPKNDHFK